MVDGYKAYGRKTPGSLTLRSSAGTSDFAKRAREREAAEAEEAVRFAVNDANAALANLIDPEEVAALTRRNARRA